MKNKRLIITVVVLICIIAFVVLCVAFVKKKSNNANNSSSSYPTSVPTQIDSKCLKKFDSEVYSAKLIEADNKQYTTLFLETNVFDGVKTIRFSYNNKKLILSTTPKELEEVEVKDSASNDGVKEFEINMEKLQTINLVFMKRSEDIVITADDVNFELK